MTTSFFEAHNYPLTSVPLPLASLDWDLRQGSKASLRIYLIFRSSALLSVLIVDGISVIKSMQSQRTWGELCQVFIEACMPDKGFLPVALYMTMDTCGAGKIKEITQNHRGTTTRKIIIGGADQAMPKSCNWATFLSDGDNKTELIQFIAGCCKAGNFQRKLKTPITITSGKDTWLLDTFGVHQLPLCNHH